MNIDFYELSFEFGFEVSALKMDGARYLKHLTKTRRYHKLDDITNQTIAQTRRQHKLDDITNQTIAQTRRQHKLDDSTNQKISQTRRQHKLDDITNWTISQTRRYHKLDDITNQTTTICTLIYAKVIYQCKSKPESTIFIPIIHLKLNSDTVGNLEAEVSIYTSRQLKKTCQFCRRTNNLMITNYQPDRT